MHFLSAALILAGPLAGAVDDKAPVGHALIPISGADGLFENVEIGGTKYHRGLKDEQGRYAPYLYLRVPEIARKADKPVYVEVTYKDSGAGRIGLKYNAGGAENYKEAEVGYGRVLTNQGGLRTAVFQLARPEFRKAQNLETDMRLFGPGPNAPLVIAKVMIFLEPTELFRRRDAKPWLGPYQGPTRNDVDVKSLRRKVLCGYQGWFSCLGDDQEIGWRHWSRDQARIAPDTLSFEMWPDLSEFGDDEKYPAPGFTYPDGKPAHLFSSANPKTVDRHFDWMKQYGIDGVLAQRFTVGLDRSNPASSTRVLGHVRAAANRTGRVFAVEYDLTGTPAEKIFDVVVKDWKWLVDEMKITQDARYLHHDGKPVLAIYGFFSDRFDARLANRLIDFFKTGKKYRVCLIGSGQWNWRAEKNVEWSRVFRRFDVYCPWNVGNTMQARGRTHAATVHWAQDLAEARRARMLYMPVIYPGFSWDNLSRKEPGSTLIPRLGGEFYWAQFSTAADLGIDMALVAMFDEVDEGTAIFKVSNAPPKQGHFVTFDGRPSDWYLRLTGAGSRLFRREIRNTKTLPIKP